MATLYDRTFESCVLNLEPVHNIVILNKKNESESAVRSVFQLLGPKLVVKYNNDN